MSLPGGRSSAKLTLLAFGDGYGYTPLIDLYVLKVFRHSIVSRLFTLYRDRAPEKSEFRGCVSRNRLANSLQRHHLS